MQFTAFLKASCSKSMGYEKHKDAIHQMAKDFVEALFNQTRKEFTFRGLTFKGLTVEGLTVEEQVGVRSLLSDPAIFREFLFLVMPDELLGDEIEKVGKLRQDAQKKMAEIEQLNREVANLLLSLSMAIIQPRRKIIFYEFIINTNANQIVKIVSDINATYADQRERQDALYKAINIEWTEEEDVAYGIWRHLISS